MKNLFKPSLHITWLSYTNPTPLPEPKRGEEHGRNYEANKKADNCSL